MKNKFYNSEFRNSKFYYGILLEFRECTNCIEKEEAGDIISSI